MGLIEPELGLELLGRLMNSNAAQVAVMDAGWGDMLRMLGSRRPSLLTSIAEEVKESGGETTTGRVDHAFRQQLLDANDATRTSLVQEYIRQELARIIGVDPSGLETDQPLSTFGLDSLLALELKNNLEGRLDFTLPMAKLMEGHVRIAGGQSANRCRRAGGRRRMDAISGVATIGRSTAVILVARAGRRHPLLRRSGPTVGRRATCLRFPPARHRSGLAAPPHDG
jgi:acyl carrier protein